jgi:hypothetical protein
MHGARDQVLDHSGCDLRLNRDEAKTKARSVHSYGLECRKGRVVTSRTAFVFLGQMSSILPGIFLLVTPRSGNALPVGGKNGRIVAECR